MKIPRFNVEFELWNLPKTYYFNPPNVVTASREYPDVPPTPVTQSDLEDSRLKRVLENISEETVLIEFFTDEVAGGPETHLHIACPVCGGDKMPGTDVYFAESVRQDLELFGMFVAKCERCKSTYLVFSVVETEKDSMLLARQISNFNFTAWDPFDRAEELQTPPV